MSSLLDADQQDLLWLLRGIPDPYDSSRDDSSPGRSRRPTADSMRTTGERWERAGADLAGLARTLEEARDRLFAGGWSGDRADTLRNRVDQMIWFARELASRCDSGQEKPERPWSAATGSEFDRGLRQLWNHLAKVVERLDSDDQVPRLPWDGKRFGVTWGDREGGYAFFLDERDDHPWSPLPGADDHTGDDLPVDARAGNHSAGHHSTVDAPIGNNRARAAHTGAAPVRAGHAGNHHTVDREQMHALYASAGIYSLPRTGPDGIVGYLPATDRDAHELFLHAGINQEERQRARRAAAHLVAEYADVGDEFRTPICSSPPRLPAHLRPRWG